LAAPADPYTLPSPSGQLPRSITLYQYEVCPFCCKVKAFLDYHKVCDWLFSTCCKHTPTCLQT
jgi:microsomal prostaglandin-E synthase 2